MSKRLQGFVAAFAVILIACGIFSYASDIYKNISVLYNDIKIVIDGKQYIPKDANGKTVEPFIYEGTTYLPVRAVAQAFDKEVLWDDKTFTVSLNSKPEQYKTKVPRAAILGEWVCDAGNVYEQLLNVDDIDLSEVVYAFCKDGSYNVSITKENKDKLLESALKYALELYGYTLQELAEKLNMTQEEARQWVMRDLIGEKLEEKGTYTVTDEGSLKLFCQTQKEPMEFDMSFEGEDLVLTTSNEIKYVLTR